MLQGAQPQARRPLRQRHQLRRGAAGCAAGARHRVDRAGERGQVVLCQVPHVAAALEVCQGGPSGSSGPSVGPGSIWSDGQPHNPTEPPTVRMPTTPPGSPPRWPPVNQRRDDGAGGGGPGRKVLVLALIGALVVLTACAGVAYLQVSSQVEVGRRLATRHREPGRFAHRFAHRVAGADHDYRTRNAHLGGETLQPSATATSTHAPTPTNTPSSPR